MKTKESSVSVEVRYGGYDNHTCSGRNVDMFVFTRCDPGLGRHCTSICDRFSAEKQNSFTVAFTSAPWKYAEKEISVPLQIVQHYSSTVAIFVLSQNDPFIDSLADS